jgi:hypothetical protein
MSRPPIGRDAIRHLDRRWELSIKCITLLQVANDTTAVAVDAGSVALLGNILHERSIITAFILRCCF